MNLSPDTRDTEPTRGPADVNAVVGGLLRDLAFSQISDQRMFGYKRAAAAVLALERPLTDLVRVDGTLAKISGIGPASTRVILEVLDSGVSSTVEQAVACSSKAADIQRRRGLRTNFFSRAETLRILADPLSSSAGVTGYRGDLQMHSEWSDGVPALGEIVEACLSRGYAFAAVTDHSYGLKIAGGMSMAEAAEQRREIDRLNASYRDRFRLIHGIEANIGSDGQLDLSPEEAGQFELVLAAPHSLLRKQHDQTDRMIAAIVNPHVRILAHPRGRMAGSRAGVVAQWEAVFAAAAREGVAIEMDGDPSRQDLDYTLAARALNAGCLFAADSDAHTTSQLRYAETAIAHARRAGIPADRIVNYWPTDRVLTWLADRSSAVS